MRLVIDLQGIQSASRFRGIGRYTLLITKAIIKNKGNHDVILVANGTMTDSISSVLDNFDGIISRENIKFWYSPGPLSYQANQDHTRIENAKLIREAFIYSLKPDLIYIPTMFEGFLDNSILSVNEFSTRIPTVATLYDLIPLQNPENYLDHNPEYKNFYLEKINYINRCDALLAISEFTENEGNKYLEDRKGNIFNVSTGCDDLFKKNEYSQIVIEDISTKYFLTKDFFLYAGGADERKNLPRLLEAYSLLPVHIKNKYLLVISGKLSDISRYNILAEAKKFDIEDQIRITGYISDDDLVKLYNLCSLFIFPSWHEGFGLPALEAMACGAVVIGANNSSLPEVIGDEDALFDPFSVADIASKIERVMTDKSLYEKLKKVENERKKYFSWDQTALKALQVFESINKSTKAINIERSVSRLKLAYISPLSPERTGIAKYSEDLIPYLASFYDIDVVCEQSVITSKFIDDRIKVINSNDFLKNSQNYDHILYHFGNSPYHEYMHKLITLVPGVVCLHDFYMSNYLRYIESRDGGLGIWERELFFSHGYSAIIERAEKDDDEYIMYKYPSNFSLLAAAKGIITHSSYSYSLACHWYDKKVTKNWEVIPLLRRKPIERTKYDARKRLDIAENDFIICSFGMLDSSKLNDVIIKSFNDSCLKHSNVKIIFVGESSGPYKKLIDELISNFELGDKVIITGWVDDEKYYDYLISADIGIQLRSHSRGETSAALLDCLNYGLPTIYNANGSMAEISSEIAYRLNDDFEIDDLTIALNNLFSNQQQRELLSTLARGYINKNHSPDYCAEMFYKKITQIYNSTPESLVPLLAKLSVSHKSELNKLAGSLAETFPILKPKKRIFYDVTATARTSLRTGIERVTRTLVAELIKRNIDDVIILPVYMEKVNDDYILKHAHGFVRELFNKVPDCFNDEPVDFYEGDILFSSDLNCDDVVDANIHGFYLKLKQKGMKICFMVNDILPVTNPEFFPPGSSDNFKEWLKVITSISEKIVFISKSVLNSYENWCDKNNINIDKVILGWSHLGADIDAVPVKPSDNSKKNQTASLVDKKITFLMVGTLEPRKGHLQVLEAFDILWNKGIDVNLIIVGKEGWLQLPNELRRTIPNIVSKLKKHSELNHHLFWFDHVDDNELNSIYSSSSALIFASEAEGFGLPLIEAARKSLPLIIRDISVFREIVGENAFYFDSQDPNVLSDAIIEWIMQYKDDTHPTSENLSWLTWSDSASHLVRFLLK
ncbi:MULTISPECIES: glycosyltransferase [Yersinia]|uniref:glycosyltransferase n=3 Tax=Yersiniaceae TaxID=1903411 RepID=UPI000FFB8643|nr:MULTISPECIES: glycosyltransferase [Yersinia]RXA97768.1 glycosyltransferase [Yersinia sp. 2105 StPb PI]